MVVNQRLHACRRSCRGAVGLRLELQVFFALRRFLQEVLGDIAILIHTARFKLQQSSLEHFQPPAEVVIRRVAALLENGTGAGRQFFFQPFLHALASQVHDAINAEVEVGLFKLEQFPEERLKFFEWSWHS